MIEHFGQSIYLSDDSILDMFHLVPEETYDARRRLKVYAGGRYTGMSVLRGSKAGMIISRGHDAPKSAVQFDMVERLGEAWARNFAKSKVFKLFPREKKRYGAFGLGAPCCSVHLDDRFKSAFYRRTRIDAHVLHLIHDGRWLGTLGFPQVLGAYDMASTFLDMIRAEAHQVKLMH